MASCLFKKYAMPPCGDNYNIQHQLGCYSRASKWFVICPEYHVSFSENNQRRSRKTQLKGFGALEVVKGLKSIIVGTRDRTYLMAASTNTGFSGSKESSPSTFLISNAQMRFMRKP